MPTKAKHVQIYFTFSALILVCEQFFPKKLWTILGKCYKELTMVKWILAEISYAYVRKSTLVLCLWLRWCITDALVFLRYIDEKIRVTHRHDEPRKVEPVEPRKVPDYSLPQTGHAYYFTTSGNQIRFPRLFSIDNVANRIKNHDNESTRSKCWKKYQSVGL